MVREALDIRDRLVIPELQMHNVTLLSSGAAAIAALVSPLALGATTVPPVFTVSNAVTGVNGPTAMAVAPDGRIFVALKDGRVRVAKSGALLPTPFIDLRDEVGASLDRGLIGIALDPNWADNRTVYLLYTIDPVYGPPEEFGTDWPTIGRLVRYSGTFESDGNVADLATREVLLGKDTLDGIPCCFASHSVGALRFGLDGSLFVGAGEGANYNIVDTGGDPKCAAMFGAENDIGAFRAQRLDCLAGKVLRVDPETGMGLPSNPFFDGDPASARSRVWAYGVRNPFRMAIDPSSKSPGALYVADVGWSNTEEISRVEGGENLGWPCKEGKTAQALYGPASPPSDGCSGLPSPGEPGGPTAPVVEWDHWTASKSVPPGVIGGCAAGCVYQDDPRVPKQWRGLYFADYNAGWIRLLRPGADGGLGEVAAFATDVGQPVDLAIDPLTGDLLCVARLLNRVERIHWKGADIDG